VLEVEVAERLASAYPGAETVRFLKTGAEAVQAAVRIARVATARERVLYCGYHGWLDGAFGGAGVPPAVARLWRPVPFDDVAALEAAAGAGEPPAAIVLEPVVERAPARAWLEAARGLATDRGAVLVFDEMKTAFRLGRGGAAERWGVRPDLATLGKALANGLPLAAVVGRADLMARLKDTWVSSTLATEFVSLAAARAVLDVWDRTDVAGHIARVGGTMLQRLSGEGRAAGCEVSGIPEMWFLRFADAGVERRFLLACVGHGVLMKRGPYNFPSLAHGEAEVTLTLTKVRAALEEAGG
jgi:glutamate-1-semialdehyde aminotransferase